MRTAALLFVFTAGCKCLPVPVTDTTPPDAGIIVEYRPVGGGPRVTKTLGATSPDETVDADKNDVIAVIYSAGDHEGVKMAELEYDMSYSTGTSIVQPLLSAIRVSSNCPKDALLGSHNFASDGHPWRYVFGSRADNWLGASTRSGRLTVRTQ